MKNINLKSFNSNKETKMYMPNEIFNDLATCKELVRKVTVSPHVAFAYSYTWLSYWLYWTCKWEGDVKVTQEVMKSILGYSKTNKTLNFITKKDGVLDKLGYTETTTNFPISWWFEEGDLSFETTNDLKQSFKDNGELIPSWMNGRNFIIKYPIKAFYRTPVSEKKDGTFYNVENTHHIPFEVFKYCMEHDDIGTTGFYLYAFLKHKNDLFIEGAQFSRGRLQAETGVKKTDLDKYLENMQRHNMIDVDVADVKLNSPLYEREANTYRVWNFHGFGKTSKPITKRKVYPYNEDTREVS